jgi:DHA1 family tetracycline resistance protein-like MFS transporter
MNHSKKSLIPILPLFLVLFIDGMGLGIFFPILNGLIISTDSTFLPKSVSLIQRELYYGIIISVFMFCWFFGAALLGDWSDTIGRKRALIICLLGSFLGYLISAIAVVYSSFWGIIVGRVIAGFTAGSQPIAQAAIVDVSDEDSLADNMGWMLLCVSLGFVCGPLIGGLLSDHALLSLFDFDFPLYFAAAISLLNAIFLWTSFKETFTIKGKLHFRLHHAIMIFISAFTHKTIRQISLIFFVMMLGWSAYFNFSLVYMENLYHLGREGSAFFMGAIGLGFALGFGPCLKFLTARYSLKSITMTGFILSGIIILSIISIPNQVTAWIGAVLVGTTVACSYSTILTIFSKQVDANEQGWVMGVTGAVLALTFGVTALCTGYAARYGVNFPLIFSGVCLVLSGLLMIRFKTKK